MTFLLDTHAALWWLMEPDKLGRRARTVMEDLETNIFISTVSMFEIAQKARVGKLPYPSELLSRFPDLFREQSWQPLELSMSHALRAGSIDVPHRDPFDRLLAAQAELEGFHVLSCDPAFAAFPITTVWN